MAGSLTGCQTQLAGMTLPSGYYLQHRPQYFPAEPNFPLGRELATMQGQNQAANRNSLGIMANRLVPGLLDHYLARIGYRAQMTAEPDPGGRPSNLWKALPGDRGAHGRFDDRAHSVSRQVWLTEHREVLAGALVAAGFLVGRRRKG